MSKKKTVSLAEFKAWLSGVEEMQPKNWIPTKEQWSLIRKKISNISDNGWNVVPADTANSTAQQHVEQHSQHPPHYPAAQLPALTQPAHQAADAGPVQYAQNPQMDLNLTEPSPAAKQLLLDGKTPSSNSGEGSSFA